MPNITLGLRPVAFKVTGLLSTNIRIESRSKDGDKWVITNGFESTVMSKDGEWEFEPLPSSRTDAFIAATRFDTPEEALSKFQEVYNNVQLLG